MRTSSLTLILSLIFLVGCVLPAGKPNKSVKAGKPSKSPVTVMTYNVENLFDTKDDPKKNDETYLPIEMKKSPYFQARCRQLTRSRWVDECLNSDWDEKKLKRKLQRLADVVLQVKGGRGPDILILEEVENKSILDRWRVGDLKPAAYKPALLVEGADPRGIDVGVLTRLKSIEPPRLHELKFKAGEDGLTKDNLFPTRGILEVTLELPDGSPITVFGVHFPSQSAPTGARVQAIKKLNEIKASLPKGRMVLAAGDFNISVDEDVKHNLYRDAIGETWGVSHMIGCDKCSGTNYYHRNRAWSFLDAIILDKGLLPVGGANWRVEPKSVRVPTKSLYQVNRYGSPARFGRGDRKEGVSDHWPLVLELVPRKVKMMAEDEVN